MSSRAVRPPTEFLIDRSDAPRRRRDAPAAPHHHAKAAHRDAGIDPRRGRRPERVADAQGRRPRDAAEDDGRAAARPVEFRYWRADTRQRRACVLPRDKAVLLQLGGLTAVINADEALFFDNGGEERPRAALRRIGASVEFAFQHYKAPAFELAVLEAVLAEVSSSFQRRRDLYEPVVQKQLREASCEFDGFGVDGLHRLSAFDGALMSFEAETRQALQVLDELLASDEDMLGLLLSERRAGTSVDPERHGVVELLLEAYHRRLSAVAGDVAELRGKVQSATELGRVTIDLNRNNIIKCDAVWKSIAP